VFAARCVVQVKHAAGHAAHEIEDEAKDNKTGLYTGETRKDPCHGLAVVSCSRCTTLKCSQGTGATVLAH